MRNDPLVDEEGYPSYNKPYIIAARTLTRTRTLTLTLTLTVALTLTLTLTRYSLMAWLDQEEIAEDYIMMLDGDMLLREPIDPVALGAARGRVVSAEYTYLVGTEPGRGFAERFIATRLVRRLAQVGGFHIFHKEDLRKIAPLWLEYTKQVRAFGHAEPEAFFRESMQLPPDVDEATTAVRRKQAMCPNPKPNPNLNRNPSPSPSPSPNPNPNPDPNRPCGTARCTATSSPRRRWASRTRCAAT